MKFATDELQRSAEMPTWPEYVRFTDETAAYPGVNTRGTVPLYVRDGLRAEIGEIYGVLARVERDNSGVLTEDYRQSLIKEIGDVLWFCARYSLHDLWTAPAHADVAAIWAGKGPQPDGDEALLLAWVAAVDEQCTSGVADGVVVVERLAEFAVSHGVTLQHAAAANMAKLRDRKARGVIQGKGDSR